MYVKTIFSHLCDLHNIFFIFVLKASYNVVAVLSFWWLDFTTLYVHTPVKNRHSLNLQCHLRFSFQSSNIFSYPKQNNNSRMAKRSSSEMIMGKLEEGRQLLERKRDMMMHEEGEGITRTESLSSSNRYWWYLFLSYP